LVETEGLWRATATLASLIRRLDSSIEAASGVLERQLQIERAVWLLMGQPGFGGLGDGPVAPSVVGVAHPIRATKSEPVVKGEWHDDSVEDDAALPG
jgi:hypothetical protein